jgi:hypothetical protein
LAARTPSFFLRLSESQTTPGDRAAISQSAHAELARSCRSRRPWWSISSVRVDNLSTARCLTLRRRGSHDNIERTTKPNQPADLIRVTTRGSATKKRSEAIQARLSESPQCQPAADPSFDLPCHVLEGVGVGYAFADSAAATCNTIFPRMWPAKPCSKASRDLASGSTAPTTTRRIPLSIR